MIWFKQTHEKRRTVRFIQEVLILRTLRDKFKGGIQLNSTVFASLMVAGTLFAWFVPSVGAGKDTVVSIAIDGERQTVATDASTVADVLTRAKVSLQPEDLVEPALATPIDSEVFNINVYRAKPATVVDNGQEIKVQTAYQSPKLIAEKSAGIAVYPEDQYQTELITDFLGQDTIGHRITIDRAVPVKAVFDGQVLDLRTQANTVGELLAEKGLVVNGDDIVSPSADTAITANQLVSITRVGRQVAAIEEVAQRPIEYVYNNDQPVGWQEVREEGADGKKLVTYEITIHNGQEVARKALQTVEVTKPVKRVVVVGNREANPSGNKAIGYQMAVARGWGGSEWSCLEALWTKESGWDHTKSNYQGSGAYGIPQALPGSKMSSHGDDWQTNPATQIAWGLDYIEGRYGSPCGAWSHSQARNWY